MSSNQESYAEVSSTQDKVNCPQHFVFCENGVCKIDISYNDDNRFDVYRTYLRGLFEECLSKSVLAIQNSSERLEKMDSFNKDYSEFLNMFNNTSGYSLVKNVEVDTNEQDSARVETEREKEMENVPETSGESRDAIVEVYEVNTSEGGVAKVDNTFMESIKLFAQSQNNFSEVLLKYSKNLEDQRVQESESDNESEYETSDSDSDESTEYENEEKSEYSDSEDEEVSEPRGLLSVVRYFAESQRNFSTSLYNFMSSGTFYSR